MAAGDGGAEPARPRITGNLVLAVLGPGIAFAVTAVDPLVFSLNLAEVSRALHVPPERVGFLGGAATLVVAAAVLAVGSLGDAHGLRRLLMLALSAEAAVNLVAALSPSYGFLLVMRLLDGLSLAGLLGLSLALLTVSVPAQVRPAAIGIFMAVDMFLFGVVPAVGGWVVAGLGWRGLFLVAPVLSLAALALTARYVREPAGRQARGVDVVGVALFGTALLGFVHGIAVAQNGIGRPAAWVPLVVSAVAAAAFVRHERRTPRPALDLALFRRPAFAVAVLAVLTLNFLSGGFGVVLGQFGSDVLNLPAQTIGLLYLPGTTLSAAAAVLAGRLVARRTARPVLVTGLLLLAASGLLMAATAAPGMRPWHLVPATWLCNLGALVASTAASDRILAAAPPGRAGAVAAVQPAFGMTGYALGPTVYLLLLGAFFHRRWLADAAARGVSATQAQHAVDAVRGAMTTGPGATGYDPNLLRQASGLDLGLDFTVGLRLTMLTVTVVPLVLAVVAWLLMPRGAGPARPDTSCDAGPVTAP